MATIVSQIPACFMGARAQRKTNGLLGAVASVQQPKIPTDAEASLHTDTRRKAAKLNIGNPKFSASSILAAGWCTTVLPEEKTELDGPASIPRAVIPEEKFTPLTRAVIPPWEPLPAIPKQLDFLPKVEK